MHQIVPLSDVMPDAVDVMTDTVDVMTDAVDIMPDAVDVMPDAVCVCIRMGLSQIPYAGPAIHQ